MKDFRLWQVMLAAGALTLAGPVAATAQTVEEEGDSWTVEEREVEREVDDVELQDEDTVEEAVTPESNVIVVEPTTRRADTGPNVAVEVGGGFSNYTDDLNDATSPGGSWDVRGIFGLKSPIAFELAYVGAANNLDVGDNTAIATSGEGLVRLNFMDSTSGVQPFIGGGVSYFRLDLDSDLADLVDLDGTEALGFPVTAGIQFYPTDNFTLAARGSYRFLTDALDSAFPAGDQWNAGITLGAAF